MLNCRAPRRSLRTCENMEHMTFLRNIPEGATAILVECRGESRAAMQVRLLMTGVFHVL
jgi:hypothetical protein